ncbi:hypothetical protein HPP92_011050 [Vanilla planifolia]|uniref:Uncharacterized protein n=1 Tax=Vanilla planifolia TaxID=51239 RepID=A0A835V4N1_VANPL|nr:hypothetical protein HPP92_011050 [Vanilla planifolia]
MWKRGEREGGAEAKCPAVVVKEGGGRGEVDGEVVEGGGGGGGGQRGWRRGRGGGLGVRWGGEVERKVEGEAKFSMEAKGAEAAPPTKVGEVVEATTYGQREGPPSTEVMKEEGEVEEEEE